MFYSGFVSELAALFIQLVSRATSVNRHCCLCCGAAVVEKVLIMVWDSNADDAVHCQCILE
jgi:hypothetical protein